MKIFVLGVAQFIQIQKKKQYIGINGDGKMENLFFLGPT